METDLGFRYFSYGLRIGIGLGQRIHVIDYVKMYIFETHINKLQESKHSDAFAVLPLL